MTATERTLLEAIRRLVTDIESARPDARWASLYTARAILTSPLGIQLDDDKDRP